MVEVKLSESEIQIAAFVGMSRQLYALRTGLQSAHGAGAEHDWQYHINGAMGEMALAKYLNIFWSGTVGVLNLPDVGKLEVRTATSPDHRLIVREPDSDGSLFVFVTGVNGNYSIWGFLAGKDAKKNAFLVAVAGRPNAYFVPKESLQPIEDIWGWAIF